MSLNGAAAIRAVAQQNNRSKELSKRASPPNATLLQASGQRADLGANPL
jgi:hypothetical protein